MLSCHVDCSALDAVNMQPNEWTLSRYSLIIQIVVVMPPLSVAWLSFSLSIRVLIQEEAALVVPPMPW